MNEDLRGRCLSAFAGAFGDRPEAAGRAPGRVNLIGEHTDYNEGFVLPMAIDLDCLAMVRRGRGRRSRAHSADAGETVEFDAVDRPSARVGGWGSYVAGVCATMAAALDEDGGGLDIAVASDVPLGGGLSSSAALEVAVATALERLWGHALPAREKALACQRAEHEFAGVPCGIMDQLVACLGERDRALLIDCRDLGVRAVRMPEPGRALVMVVHSGVAHALASGEYAKRRAACRLAANRLGVRALRDAPMERVLAARLSEEERRCASHVVGECERTLAGARALESGDLAAFGGLMAASHESLRTLYRVSCPELDTLVELASAVPGVIGARMTGGGFGGSIVALVEPAAREAFISRVPEAYRRRHGRACRVMEVRASAGCSAEAV